MADRREPARGLVDREDGDRVVAAVRHVDVASGRFDEDLGRREPIGRLASRHRRQVVDLLERAALGVVPEGCDGHVRLAVDVGVPTARVEGEVPRGGAGVELPERRVVGDELPVRRVEPVGHHLVDALVVDEQPLTGRVQRREVGVGALLGRARTRAVVLDEVGHGAEPPVLADREDRHVAVLVVGDEQEAAGRIGAEVARVAADGRLFGQLR